MLLSLSGKVRFFRPLSSFPFFFSLFASSRFILFSWLSILVCGFSWGFAALICAHGSCVWIHASYLGAHDLLCVESRQFIDLIDEFPTFCVGSPLLRGFIPLMCGLTSLMFGFMTTYVWMVNSYVWAHGSHVWIHDSFVWILMCGLPMGGSMTLICEFTILMYWFTPFIYMAPRLLCGLTTLMCGSATYM
jgi:hypothetical protein